MKIGRTSKSQSLVIEQLPLLPEVHDPLTLPMGPHTERVNKSHIRAELLGSAFSMLIILSSVLYLRTQPIIPKVPIPISEFGSSGSFGNLITADVLSLVENEKDDIFINYLEPKEGERVYVRAGEHTLIRVPYSIVNSIPVSKLFHPVHIKMRSFFVYKYVWDEPPFHEESMWRSRILGQLLGSGKNFTVMGGDLLYIMAEEEGVTDLTVAF